YQKETGVTYGILEFDLGDATTLAVGGSYQNNNTRSPLWGALPLYRTDGTQTDYDVETSTSADWSYWNGEYTNAFVELTHGLGGGWEAQATLTHREMMSDSKLFYVYGTPNPDTPQSDLFAYPSRYELDNNQFIGDLRVSGPYQLFGREHQAVVGASYWESDLNDLSRYGQGIGTPIVDLEFWTGDYPEPAFDASVDGSDWVDRQKSAFAATQFRLTDELAFIGGARVISLTSRGTTYGTSKDTEYSGETVPYAGLVLDITDNVSAYASYAEIFDPQTEIDINRDRIDPIEGTTRELGLKSAFYGGAVQTTVAVFETEQDNLAEAAGTIPASVDTFYIGVDGIESRGYEVDVSGEVLPGLQVAAGFTSVNINGPEGDRARTFTPERIARLSTAYQLRSIERLKVGASINWQDDIYRYEGVATTGAFAGAPIYVRQDSYARVNLMARYDVTSRFNAQLNLNNVTDEKYLTSLYWSQGYYGAPRNASLKLNWAF
ncbi:MAG: TonB-dependent siderophore receptor, partial [Alcanivoracaceae bacterium]